MGEKIYYEDLETPDTNSPMPAPSSAPPSEERSRSKMADTQDVDGAFEGSFAGTARDIAVARSQPWYYRREYYLDGWADPVIRRAAFVEVFATTCSIYISGQFSMTLMNAGVTQPVAYVGIYNAVFLTLFVYATATATGGHINPMITFATMLCGLTPIPRGVVLLTAQILGGILAGGVLLGTWGQERAIARMGGGNFFDPTEISPGQVLLIEVMSSMTILYLAIGTGLDPRQQVLYGRQLGPVLVGLSLGLVSSSTTGVAPGYTGASMNPARALAVSIAGRNWHRQYFLLFDVFLSRS
ncbi:aquaporin-like protein [Chaetomium sp. MPI-CAGE-AT-0009]|nr:aquaporin-like protein [Chaetomium sp. MPI-CAGE-AT-0009]